MTHDPQEPLKSLEELLIEVNVESEQKNIGWNWSGPLTVNSLGIINF